MKHDRGRATCGRFAIEFLIVVSMLAALALVASAQYRRSSGRTTLSRAYAELQVQRKAVESYTADHIGAPRMSWGTMSTYVSVGSQPICPPSFPTSWNEAGAGGTPLFRTLCKEMTTPVAYLSSLLPDVYSSSRLYTYQSAATHEFLLNCVGSVPVPGMPGFIYSPMTRPDLRRMHNYFGEYVLWSQGPSGTTTSFDFWEQYDPTNGATSTGHIFISQRQPTPRFSPSF